MRNILTESHAARLATFFAFSALFGVETYFLSLHLPDLFSHNLVEHALLLAALGIAAFRGGRAISGNGVFAWLRAPLCVESADSSGAGDSANSRYTGGVLSVVGDLICCPICSGTWTAVLLLTTYVMKPAWGSVLIFALAAAGIGETFNYYVERAEWQARVAREEAGSQWLAKNPETRWPATILAAKGGQDLHWLETTRRINGRRDV